MTEILLKRAYEPIAKSDGQRILVERLWPRGVKKDALQLSAWMKDVAPSTNLRKWFSHDPEKWTEFRKRYFAELDANPESWRKIAADPPPRITLVYSSHDQEHNNAVALRDYLQSKLKSGKARTSSRKPTQGKSKKR